MGEPPPLTNSCSSLTVTVHPGEYVPPCMCLLSDDPRSLSLHEPREHDALSCSARRKVEAYVDALVEQKANTFNLHEVGLDRAEWRHVVVLPEAVLRLRGTLKHLRLYGSAIQRIPEWISQLALLESVDPYTSYALHYFPFEVVHCANLKQSRVSTRAYYGNQKNTLPVFPELEPDPSLSKMKRLFPLQYLAARVCERNKIPLPPYGVEVLAAQRDAKCSVCQQRYVSVEAYTYWVMRHLASYDVVPMLVRACSLNCVKALEEFRAPNKDSWYSALPHKGGRRKTKSDK